MWSYMHDAAVSKNQHQHLDLKDQWALLEQLAKVLEPLQMATTVFGYEVNTLRYSPVTTSQTHALPRISTRGYTQKAAVCHA